MIDTIIFDMDGVIIDSEPIYIDILREVYEQFGVEADYKRDHKEAQGTAAKDWYAHIIEKHNLKNVSANEMAEMERDLMLEHLKDPSIEKPIFEGIVETLKEIKKRGYKTALASSSSPELIEAVLELSGLKPYFDLVISGYDSRIKKSKPDPGIFQITAADLGSEPTQCLVIEDSETGLYAAKLLGMQTAAYLSSPHQISLEDADFVFDDYANFFQSIDF